MIDSWMFLGWLAAGFTTFSTFAVEAIQLIRSRGGSIWSPHPPMRSSERSLFYMGITSVFVQMVTIYIYIMYMYICILYICTYVCIPGTPNNHGFELDVW